MEPPQPKRIEHEFGQFVIRTFCNHGVYPNLAREAVKASASRAAEGIGLDIMEQN